jgi:transposase
MQTSPVRFESNATNRDAIIGIDLGLKVAAHGTIIEQDGGKREIVLDQSRFYRDLEPKLAEAQRNSRKRQVKTIHAKIANRRKDTLHKFSRQLVEQAGYIFIGTVSSSFAVASAPKSALDVSWATLRNLVQSKAITLGLFAHRRMKHGQLKPVLCAKASAAQKVENNLRLGAGSVATAGPNMIGTATLQ